MDKSILIVDDEKIILKSLEKHLRHEGYIVSTAMNGEEALIAFAEDSFDLVITDIVMVPGDGIQVLKGVKESKPTTGVIIITGFGDVSSAISALRYGADDYLLKPYDLDELIFRVAKCLQKFACQKKLIREKEKTSSLAQYNEELTKIQRTLVKEIVEHKETQKKLEERQDLLTVNSKSLEEANMALKHLLDMREGEKLHLEGQALAALKDSVLYHLHEIQKDELTEPQKANLQLVESNLNRFIQTFTAGIATTFLKLTPMELKIITLIQSGRMTKDIATELNVSIRTVENHRLNIRKKLGIRHSGTNLKSSLNALY